jgi:O-acetyl-ADP-ribose deacetylase (regulator of RNase III)
MTIEYIKNGDLFQSGCEALVNPVNCVGIAGKGLALEFRNRYPDYFSNYRWQSEVFRLSPGWVNLFPLFGDSNPRAILSFATKDHWHEPSQIKWIEWGLNTLCPLLERRGIKSVAVPALGCGLGSLKWEEVRPLMEQAFSQYPDILFKVYEPLETTGH